MYTCTRHAQKVKSKLHRHTQTFTIPSTRNYTLSVAGAQGGTAPAAVGGKGAVITGTAFLTCGTKVSIAVGGSGSSAASVESGAGGGGGIAHPFTVFVSSHKGVQFLKITSRV